MKILICLLALLASLAGTRAFAWTPQDGGYVGTYVATQVWIDAGMTQSFVQPAEAVPTTAACPRGEYVVFDTRQLGFKTMFATALAAHLANRPVYLLAVCDPARPNPAGGMGAYVGVLISAR